tara:strand:+ start:2050 stop:2193 length:144 start_codon:yes stop_codon:yes gene_type:complete
MNDFFETAVGIASICFTLLVIVMICLSLLACISLPFVGVIALLAWIF